jgi:hypothetical protein
MGIFASNIQATNINSTGIITAAGGSNIMGNVEVSGISTFSGNISVGVDTSSGLVLTSQNGTKYQLIVANDGTLSTIAI